MSFELSFSPEFFYNEGEPYDVNVEVSTKPTSVYQAICSMSDKEWRALAKHYRIKRAYLTPDFIMEKVQETNTCTDIRTPVEVWIDPKGHHTVWVY